MGNSDGVNNWAYQSLLRHHTGDRVYRDVINPLVETVLYVRAPQRSRDGTVPQPR